MEMKSREENKKGRSEQRCQFFKHSKIKHTAAKIKTFALVVAAFIVNVALFIDLILKRLFCLAQPIF